METLRSLPLETVGSPGGSNNSTGPRPPQVSELAQTSRGAAARLQQAFRCHSSVCRSSSWGLGGLPSLRSVCTRLSHTECPFLSSALWSQPPHTTLPQRAWWPRGHRANAGARWPARPEVWLARSLLCAFSEEGASATSAVFCLDRLLPLLGSDCSLTFWK